MDMSLQELIEFRKEHIDYFVLGMIENKKDDRIAELCEAMAYSVSGGKRIRGFLVMEAAGVTGINPESVVPTAAAIECFHAYSLVHDDLPAMDDDNERRGQPTTHRKYGEANAILVGDSLIPLGYLWISLAQTSILGPDNRVQSLDPERRLRVIEILGVYLGTDYLTGGQYLDLKAATTKEEYSEIVRRKTCGLFEASLLAGATLGGFDRVQANPLLTYGHHLGFAFQYVDDLLDWEQDDSPKFYEQDELRELVKANTEKAIAAVSEFGNRGETLRELALYLADRTE